VAAKFKLNHAGMQALLDGEVGRNAVMPHAEATLARARANAPVATGAYRASLHIVETHTDRFVARVTADVPHSLVVEFHTRTLGGSIG
jgi:hypothetical protein